MVQKKLSEDEKFSELSTIEMLKEKFPKPSGCIGIGDDAATMESDFLISVDSFVEGVHFLKDQCTLQEIAFKAFSSSLSDIVAMGALATAYYLALVVPNDWTKNSASEFFSGVEDFFKEYPAHLMGGDIVVSDRFSAAVTVLGKNNKPWLRSEAQEGDKIYCTGTLGDSYFYFRHALCSDNIPLQDIAYFRERHYRPRPRASYLEVLRSYNISSAIDISDGIVEDLQKLVKASNKAFFLNGDKIPLAIDRIGQENFSLDPESYYCGALVGGEDYELLVTSPDDIDCGALEKQGIFIKKIGEILAGNCSNQLLLRGLSRDLTKFSGYRHQSG